MKVIIEIECDNSAFNDEPTQELKRILDGVPRKVLQQLSRRATLCRHPEAADKLLDINGNTVGFVKVEN